VRVAVPTAAPRRTIVVPRDALVIRRDGNVVYRILSDNTAERVPVSIGVADGSVVEVNGSIKIGDQIVIEGNERLRPCQEVQLLGRGHSN
jgi:multidrug efflux pump subunit AcrA (membrane-fusion protein)